MQVILLYAFAAAVLGGLDDPRPEALLYGLMRLQDKIRKEGTVLRKERVIMSGDTEPTLVGERA